MSEKLIPGLGPSMKILLLSQVDESARSLLVQESGAEVRTVLEHVLSGDKERMKAVLELEGILSSTMAWFPEPDFKFTVFPNRTALTTAVDSILPQVTQKVVYEIELARCRHQLSEAQKIASRRSGARGKEARAQEIKEEDKVEIAEERCDSFFLWKRSADLILRNQQTEFYRSTGSTSEYCWGGVGNAQRHSDDLGPRMLTSPITHCLKLMCTYITS